MADGGQVEQFVVVSTCGEHQAIAQSRCHGLTGEDIHIYIQCIYIHTNRGRKRIMILVSPSARQLSIFARKELCS